MPGGRPTGSVETLASILRRVNMSYAKTLLEIQEGLHKRIKAELKQLDDTNNILNVEDKVLISEDIRENAKLCTQILISSAKLLMGRDTKPESDDPNLDSAGVLEELTKGKSK